MKGFTLIELIIYIAIVSVVLILASSFMWDIIQGNTVNDCWRETQQNARQAMEEIVRQLRKGSDPSIFKVDNGVLYENDTALTTNQVKIVDFSIAPVANTYRIHLKADYYNPNNEPEYRASVVLDSAVALIEESTPPPPPQGCWGTGGSCDPECRYSNYGLLVDYFIDPGCSDSCPSAGSFYVNPSEGCSDDGSGTCYKMENPSTQYTSCTQDGSCEGECSGTPVSCNKYHNSQECLKHGCDWETQGFCFGSCNCSRYDQNQCKLCPLCSPSGSVIPPVCKGDCQCRELTDATSCGYCPSCQWISIGPGRCTGTPYPCKEMDNKESCKDHGCQWQDTKWFWNLQDSKQGYSSYTNCQWYVR